MSPTREKASRAEEATLIQPSIYISSDNGQMACADHRHLYGRIPWHRMTGIEAASMERELAGVLRPGESLCEICRRQSRQTRQAPAEAAR